MGKLNESGATAAGATAMGAAAAGVGKGTNKNAGTGASRGTIALFTILVLGAATGNMSQTALNAMMLGVIRDFGIEVDLGQWLTTIYMLALGVSVPLTGFLTKKMGYRRYTFMTLALFLVGALIDLVAPGFWTLVIGRVLQAVSSGFAMAVMQTVGMTGFPANRTATAMGVAGIAMGFAPNIGPTIGSFFVDGVGWRWFFLLLAAIPVVLMVVAAFTVKRDEPLDSGAKFNTPSFIMCAIGFGGLLTGLSEASTKGIASLAVWIPLALGVVFLVFFVKRQNRTDNPLIDMHIFRARKYKIGFWMQNLLYGSFMGITLVIPLYVEGGMGGTAIDSGTVLLPGAIAALIFNPLSGILGDKIGKARVIRIAALVMAIGALLTFTFDQNSPVWYVAMCQGIRGIGISSSIGCTIAWMLEDLPRNKMGDGTSLSIVVRQASASLGTAAMVFLVTSVLEAFGAGMFAYTCAFAFSATLAVVMLAMAYLFVRD